MNAWSQLPNAVHIDRILESLKTHPAVWDDWDLAEHDTLQVSLGMAWNAAWYESRNVDMAVAAWAAAHRAARSVACRCAISALMAWDDSAQFLELSSDKLEVWARISDDPRAILLLPAVCVFERIKELEAA